MAPVVKPAGPHWLSARGRARRAELGGIERTTRLAVGRCQGHYCTPVLAQMIHQAQGRDLDGLAFLAPRVPDMPISLADVIAAD